MLCHPAQVLKRLDHQEEELELVRLKPEIDTSTDEAEQREEAARGQATREMRSIAVQAVALDPSGQACCSDALDDGIRAPKGAGWDRPGDLCNQCRREPSYGIRSAPHCGLGVRAESAVEGYLRIRLRNPVRLVRSRTTTFDSLPDTG